MKSTEARSWVLDKLLGKTNFTPHENLYFALYTTSPTEDGGGIEVSGGSYARVHVQNTDTNFPDAVDGIKSNGTLIEFPEATSPWGTIVAFGIHGHATNDHLMIWGGLDNNMSVDTGDQPAFAPGDLIFEET